MEEVETLVGCCRKTTRGFGGCDGCTWYIPEPTLAWLIAREDNGIIRTPYTEVLRFKSSMWPFPGSSYNNQKLGAKHSDLRSLHTLCLAL